MACIDVVGANRCLESWLGNLPSTAFTQYPSSTTQSLAMLANTSFVPAIEKPAPSNLKK